MPVYDYSFAPFLDAMGHDWFADDPELRTLLRFHGLNEGPELDRVAAYGRFAAGAQARAADEVDQPDRLPVLTPFDAHGRPHPVGLHVPEATRRTLADALRAGSAFDPNPLVRYAIAYLGMQAGEAGVICPLACTDGLVRAVDELECDEVVRAAAAHIRAQGDDAPVHAAQFVTEVQGGSDAATNLVRAVPQGDGTYRLYGKKWFCSNAWAQYWAVTARPDGAPEGPRGVALFVVPREHPAGSANGFRLDRLKDKLGTRALPTAEMTLDGAVGRPLGALDSGLSNMVRIVLSTSRFWNALSGAAFLRGAERIARSYARFRHAFGSPIEDFPLVADALDTISRDRRRHLAACLEVLRVWTRTMHPHGERASREDQIRARILVMLAKTVGTSRATRRIHDAIMVLAGNGIEERFSALPRLLRDAVIMETWEGPHGLLLGRSMLDLRRYGASDDPAAFAGLLLGEHVERADAERLGQRLRALLEDPDPRRGMVAFRDWANDLYDELGEASWRAAAAKG